MNVSATLKNQRGSGFGAADRTALSGARVRLRRALRSNRAKGYCITGAVSKTEPSTIPHVVGTDQLGERVYLRPLPRTHRYSSRSTTAGSMARARRARTNAATAATPSRTAPATASIRTSHAGASAISRPTMRDRERTRRTRGPADTGEPQTLAKDERHDAHAAGGKRKPYAHLPHARRRRIGASRTRQSPREGATRWRRRRAASH